MKLTKKLLVLLLVICQISCSVNSFTVKAADTTAADEFNPNGSGIVWSEDCVEGWELEWISCSFFDTLISARKEDTYIQYTYNEDGTRASKQVNDTITYYEYDVNKNLISETTPDVRIEYIYSFSEEDYSYYMSGFVYDGIEYEYVYENGIITGINCNGEQTVRYEYFNDIYEMTLGLGENNNWVDKTDCEDFIGNINPIRFTECYYDKETGWYYSGRYYSAGCRRFVDGVSPSRAEELKLEYPEYEVMAKTYTSGVNVQSGLSRNAQISETEAVARVIRLESPYDFTDQNGVAWVIKNRVESRSEDFKYVNTPFQVVSQVEQFTVYNSDKFNEFNEYASGTIWAHACYLANCLECGNMPEKPSGYSDQLYFSSVGSFLDFYNTDGYYFYYAPNMRASNCFFVPLGRNIVLSDLPSVNWNLYSGLYTVFCDKEWN